METLRDRMEADLKIGGYSPSTRKIYLLCRRFGQRPDANRTAIERPRLGTARCVRRGTVRVWAMGPTGASMGASPARCIGLVVLADRQPHRRWW